MDRNEYLRLRNSNQVDLNLAWELYESTPNSTPKLPLQHFYQLFQMWLSTGTASMERYFNHYDQKFNIQKLTFKNGQYKFI